MTSRSERIKRFLVLVPHQDATLSFRNKYPSRPPAAVLEETDVPWPYSELKKKAQELRQKSLEHGGELSLNLDGEREAIRFRQAAVANMAVRQSGKFIDWKIGRLVWLKKA
jgi:hypothetical protein